MTPSGTGRASETPAFLPASLRAQLREALLKVLENLHTPRLEEEKSACEEPPVPPGGGRTNFMTFAQYKKMAGPRVTGIQWKQYTG
jgi:hypothetical protein